MLHVLLDKEEWFLQTNKYFRIKRKSKLEICNQDNPIQNGVDYYRKGSDRMGYNRYRIAVQWPSVFRYLSKFDTWRVSWLGRRYVLAHFQIVLNKILFPRYRTRRGLKTFAQAIKMSERNIWENEPILKFSFFVENQIDRIKISG